MHLLEVRRHVVGIAGFLARRLEDLVLRQPGDDRLDLVGDLLEAVLQVGRRGAGPPQRVDQGLARLDDPTALQRERLVRVDVDD
eukprot:15047843-Alexandrium_andersonii.AAC.1